MSARDGQASEWMCETHRRAAALHEAAASAHRLAEQHKHEQCEAGHAESCRALELSREADQHSCTAAAGHYQPVRGGHGIAAFGHDQIAALAVELWQQRGCPAGTAEKDWFRAVRISRSGANTF